MRFYVPTHFFLIRRLKRKSMQQKKCTKCKGIKDLKAFYNRKSSKDGKRSWCKECGSKYGEFYRRSKLGLIKTIYSSQKRNSISRGYDAPNYTVDQLIKWCLKQNLFHELFDNWVASGYNRWMRPSTDRKDDYKSYTFENIKITTWRNNCESFYESKLNGLNNKDSKVVLQFDLEDNFIKEHYSVSSAARLLGINFTSIACVCRGKKQKHSINKNTGKQYYKTVITAGGFKWKYKN